MRVRKKERFQTFCLNSILFLASIHQSPYDSHQVLNGEGSIVQLGMSCTKCKNIKKLMFSVNAENIFFADTLKIYEN
jgi:hypothetical protein